MLKRLSVLLLLVLTVSLGLAATKLTFWQFMMDQPTSDAVLEQFRKENPDIQLEVVQLSWGNGKDKITTAFAAGNPPDVIELGNTWMPQFSSEGVLMNITSEIKKYPNITGWYQTEYKNQYYGFPWLLGTRVLYYNVDLFIKAGLDPVNPPKTWEEALAAAKKISALGKNIYGFGLCSGELYSPAQQWFLPAVWGNGGNVLNSDYTKATLNTKEVSDAAKFYQELARYSIKDKQTGVEQAFGEGRVGMYVAGAWSISTLQTTYPKLNFYLGFVPKPSKDKGTHASFAGGEILTVSKVTKNKDAAMKLVEYLLRDDVAMLITKRVPQIYPSNRLAILDPWWNENPLYQMFVKQNTYAVAAPLYTRWEDVEIELTSMIEEIILDYSDVDKTLKKYNDKIQGILDRYK